MQTIARTFLHELPSTASRLSCSYIQPSPMLPQIWINSECSPYLYFRLLSKIRCCNHPLNVIAHFHRTQGHRQTRSGHCVHSISGHTWPSLTSDEFDTHKWMWRSIRKINGVTNQTKQASNTSTTKHAFTTFLGCHRKQFRFISGVRQKLINQN